MDKERFIEGVNNDTNHRILLWKALELTKGKVVEFGSGYGSTPYLKEYCKKNKRKFETYDNNEEWAKKTGSKYLGYDNWNELNITDVDVLFIDHAPGESRKEQLVKYKDIAKIIVVHDTEPTGAGDYKVREQFQNFKYVKDYESDGAWATILSNYIDITA